MRLTKRSWIIAGQIFIRTAWTGGDRPTSQTRKRKDFREIRSDLFREQVRECGGLDLWKCAGTSSLDRARIFWNRATLDAWRTVTNGRMAS